MRRMSKLEHPALWFRPEQLSEVQGGSEAATKAYLGHTPTEETSP